MELLDIEHAEIKRTSRRKTILIEVKPGGILRVTAPYRTSKSDLQEVLLSKQHWIAQQRLRLKDYPAYQAKTFTPGEKFLFLGSLYQLDLSHTKNVKPKLVAEKLKVSGVHTPDKIRKQLQLFYREEALKVFQTLTKQYANRINLQPKSINIRTYRKRWGSCNSKGEITYNWKLVMAPIKIIEHVVLHELCHLQHMNHSKQFWDLVLAHMPDYQARATWLNQNGYQFDL